MWWYIVNEKHYMYYLQLLGSNHTLPDVLIAIILLPNKMNLESEDIFNISIVHPTVYIFTN
jgi:hypothetical protein